MKKKYPSCFESKIFDFSEGKKNIDFAKNDQDEFQIRQKFVPSFTALTQFF